MSTVASPRYRDMTFGVTRVSMRDGKDGVRYMQADQPLAPHAARMTDRLLHWARAAPDRTFMARRLRNADGSTGDWQPITYAQALAGARSIAQALLDRGLDAERPVVVLSENDLEHALLALGCMLAGVPYSPASPAYSTVSQDYDKLRHVLQTLTPGLVYASDPARYGKAIAAAVGPDAEVVLGTGRIDRRGATPFADLLATPATGSVDAAIAATGPDTITKFLFTSGSTKLPKAVINTHGMWCANQQQMRQSMPVLAQEPPVLVDWLPWNHT
ncbi:MAG: AMP-binding protein, partial [Pseudomonadota bacterium]|nr:AMP-binding protein [Pseudomonadota bacterium]